MTIAALPVRAVTPAPRLLPDAPILVATDGTDFARPVLDAALELMKTTGAPVRIIAVLRDLPLIPLDFGIVVAERTRPC